MAVLLAASAVSAPKLVLHEWGTFTAVAGEDGAAIEWRPLAGPSDLPSFVYTPQKNGLRFPPRGKGDMSGTVRMETPVIYFYADQELEVSLKVGFTGGTITEWYPFARTFWGGVDWGRFKVRPHTAPVLPTEPAPSHYYPAREVDAAPVQVCGDGRTEHEKFLFYRGVGTFPLPLTAQLSGGSLNLGGVTGTVVVFERDGARAGVRVVDAGAAVQRPELTGTVEDAQRAVLALLRTTGLYEKEARAMLATWKDTWFEDGLRVLYVLPRATTDALLPLTVSPAPSESVRVLVGRLELLSPDRVTAFRAAVKSQPEAAVRQKYGRFAEPLLTRALAVQHDPKLEALLQRWREAVPAAGAAVQ